MVLFLSNINNTKGPIPTFNEVSRGKIILMEREIFGVNLYRSASKYELNLITKMKFS